MNISQKICAGIAQLAFLFFGMGVSAQTLPNGTYSRTSLGAMEIDCVSSDLCFASYTNGKSFLYFSSPGEDGEYYGYWAEAGSSQPCSKTHQFPNIRTNAWGKVHLQFDFDGDFWTGSWGYCDAQPNSTLDGERGGATQTQYTRAQIKTAAAAYLLGDPYGQTTAQVMENIVDIWFGADTVCNGPNNWVVSVHVPAGGGSDAISGSLIIDDANGTPVCIGLPFLR